MAGGKQFETDVAIIGSGMGGGTLAYALRDSGVSVLIVEQGDFKVFVDPFSAQYISGVIIDYTSSMQGSGFTFKNPNSTGGCGCGSSFSA